MSKKTGQQSNNNTNNNKKYMKVEGLNLPFEENQDEYREGS